MPGRRSRVAQSDEAPATRACEIVGELRTADVKRRSGVIRARRSLGHTVFWILVFALHVVSPAAAATTITIGTDVTKIVIKGTLVTPEQTFEGDLVIDGDTIACVDVTCSTPTGATVIRVT